MKKILIITRTGVTGAVALSTEIVWFDSEHEADVALMRIKEYGGSPGDYLYVRAIKLY